MNFNRIISYLIAVAIFSWLVLHTLFIVDQRQYAIVSGVSGNKFIKEPGLHAKLPPPFELVQLLDNEKLTLDLPDATHFVTSEKIDIAVGAYVKWNIADPSLYSVRLGGEESNAHDQILKFVKDALGIEFAKHTMDEVISDQHATIVEAVQQKVSREVESLGVKIDDIRLTRINYVEQNSIYDRMKSERQQIANGLRSQGTAEADSIQAEADGKRTVLLADAYREAEKIRGQGDAKAAQIYSEAFGQNPEFYRFYRSLEAYRASFKNRNDVMVVDSNSEFFKYMKNPGSENAKK